MTWLRIWLQSAHCRSHRARLYCRSSSAAWGIDTQPRQLPRAQI